MKLNYDVTAGGLVRLWNYFSHHIIASPGMAHPMQACFEEAYVVMGAARTMPLLGDARMTALCRRFNRRMLDFQGVHWPEMFDMGYGYNRNAEGVVNCSCVADNASTANAMLEVVEAFPGLPENEEVLNGVRRFLIYCLDQFRTETGVMGVGVLNHAVNPPGMKEYWCANALLGATLIRFAKLTGDAQLREAAVPMLEYCATFAYKETLWQEWNRSAPQQILVYTMEGLVEALADGETRELLNMPLRGVSRENGSVAAEGPVPAQAPNLVETDLKKKNRDCGTTILSRLENRYREFTTWLQENQMADGSFEPPPVDHYLCYEPRMASLLLESNRWIHLDPDLENTAARQLRFMAGPAGKLRYGLFANDFASGLALLSFATAGTLLRQRDGAAWEAAVERVFDRGEEIW